MPSSLQDTNLGDIDWDSLTVEQLRDVAANDDRSTAQDKAKEQLDLRLAPAPVQPLDEYNPRTDPGPPRREDVDALAADDTPVENKEVPLEDSRKDETTVLATDVFNSEGKRIN